MFYDVQICKPVWMGICAAILLVLMQFSRSLHAASYLCWFNMASITISVLIAIIYMIIEGRDDTLNGSYTEVISLFAAWLRS
jgi:hypothetical protein